MSGCGDICGAVEPYRMMRQHSAWDYERRLRGARRSSAYGRDAVSNRESLN